MPNSQSENDSLITTRLKTNDCDELCEIMRGWDQEYIQLKKGRFEWEITFIQIGELQIFEESYEAPLLTRGLVSPGNFAIAIPEVVLGNNFNLGQSIPHNCCLHGQEYDLKTDGHYKHIVLQAPIDQIMACSKSMQYLLIEKQVISDRIIVPNFEAWKQLNDYLRQLIVLAKTQPEQPTEQIGDLASVSTSSLIIADVLPLLVDVFTAKPVSFLPEKDSKARRLVKVAEALMSENLSYPLTLTQLCQGIGQSQRSLYYAFQAAYGLPPMQYLKVLRLNGIRRVLKSADPETTTVSKIGIDWGFWHTGQFAADYKMMFGETPSTTLKRK